MKKRLDPRLKLRRARHISGLPALNEFNAAYLLRAPTGRDLYVIVSDGEGWDHVSISLPDSIDTPTWAEMCFIKQTFFDPEECVIQYHPPASQYVNFDVGCLHLWKRQGEAFPMPPLEMV